MKTDNFIWKIICIVISIGMLTLSIGYVSTSFLILILPVGVIVTCIFTTWDRRGNLTNIVMAIFYQLASYFIMKVGFAVDGRGLIIFGFLTVFYVFAGANRR